MPISTLGDARIVVVDDEQPNVRLVSRILQSAGFRNVHGFTDPRLALDALGHEQPDLVLLDLHMPHVDGLELLRALRPPPSDPEFVPVLVLTADTTREALKQALDAGANDFVTKPFDADEVLLRVRNLLSIRFCHEELKHHNAELARELRERTQLDEQRAADRAQMSYAIRAIIERGGPQMVFQPVVELATGTAIGVEALARFGSEPMRTPDVWFADAASVGLGVELETSAISAAVGRLPELRDRQLMAVNLSPATMFSPVFGQLVDRLPLDRLVFELTEHQPVDDYGALADVTGDLRRRGALLAVDDAGAGYASLRHILRLEPDVIKLDITLTRAIDADPVKRALAASLVRFAADIGAVITAEGIETATELGTLRDLGVDHGQGYFIARPQPLDQLLGARDDGLATLAP